MADNQTPTMIRCMIGFGIMVECNKETNMFDITVDPAPIIPKTDDSPGRDGGALRAFMREIIASWQAQLDSIPEDTNDDR